MAYSDFTFPEVLVKFGLTVSSDADLFSNVADAPPSAFLLELLKRHETLAAAINTEKGWSEYVIAPLLGEVWSLARERQVTLYSGTEFAVDKAEGLTGYCDFILGFGPQLYYVTAPLVTIIEAKKEDINGGLGQCAAAMIAAQKFNRRAGTPLADTFGCVTSGPLWRFLHLRDHALMLDSQLRQLADLPKLLGIFLHILGVTPKGATDARA